MENPYDVHCITAASAALLIGGVPFAGPIAGVRMAHIHGRWVPFPTHEELETRNDRARRRRTRDRRRRRRRDDDRGRRLRAHARRSSHDGASKPTEELLADGLDAAKPYRQASSASCRASSSRRSRSRADVDRDARVRPDDVDGSREGGGRSEHARQRCTIAGKAERNTTLDAIKAEVVAQLESRVRRGAARRGQGCASARSRRRSSATQHRRARQAHRRPRAEGPPATVRRGRAARPRRTAPGCSSAVRRRCSRSRRSRCRAGAVHRRRRALRQDEAVHAPLQLPAVLDGRGVPDAWAAPPRDRSRCARREGGARRRAERGRVPVRDPRGVRGA